MPSRKQRRRRQKLHRHEYEYVVETDEGEVPLRELEKEEGRNGTARPRSAQPHDRRGRPIPQPSIRRVLRRAAIFAPILVVFVYLLYGNELEPAEVAFQAFMLLLFFIPFSYLVDVLVYRMWMRRQRRDQGASKSR